MHSLQACDQCRIFKAKCDEGQPFCTRCKEKKLSCVYKEVQPQAVNKLTRELLNRLTAMEDKITDCFGKLDTAQADNGRRLEQVAGQHSP